MGVSIGGSIGPIRASVPLTSRPKSPRQQQATMEANMAGLSVAALILLSPLWLPFALMYWMCKYLLVMPFVWMARGRRSRTQTVPQYRPGDVANGHILTSTGVWVPVR